jgi:hypothetical protein
VPFNAAALADASEHASESAQARHEANPGALANRDP